MMRPKCFGKDATRPMGGFQAESYRRGVLITLGLVACSSGPVPSPRDVADANDVGRTLYGKSADERALLVEVPSLPSGTPRRVGGATVVADAAYAAASGRACRVLHITEASTKVMSRLACSDGKSWFFVPDVFGASGTTAAAE